MSNITCSYQFTQNFSQAPFSQSPSSLYVLIFHTIFRPPVFEFNLQHPILSPTLSLPHSLTPSLFHSLTPSLPHSLTPFTPSLSPFTFHPSPFTLLPSPFSLLPSPFSLLPSPFSLLPSPYFSTFLIALSASASMMAYPSLVGWTPSRE